MDLSAARTGGEGLPVSMSDGPQHETCGAWTSRHDRRHESRHPDTEHMHVARILPRPCALMPFRDSCDQILGGRLVEGGGILESACS